MTSQTRFSVIVRKTGSFSSSVNTKYASIVTQFTEYMKEGEQQLLRWLFEELH